MGFISKNNDKVAFTKEDTQGTFKDVTDSKEYVQLVEDGFSLEVTKEAIDRNLIGQGLKASVSQVGLMGATGSAKLEYKSGTNEGEAPQYGLLLESALGKVDTITGDTIGDGSTEKVIVYTNTFDGKVGDTILIKGSIHHVSPITEIDTNAKTVTLLIDAPQAPVNGDIIAPLTTYTTDDSLMPSMSCIRYREGKVKDEVTGIFPTSLNIGDMATAQIPSLEFAFEGLRGEKKLEDITIQPSFDSKLPPIALNAVVMRNGVAVETSEISLSVENTLSILTSITSKYGKINSKITKRNITGSFTVIPEDDNIDNWNNFLNNEVFSMFIAMRVPTSTENVYEDYCTIYMPNISVTALTDGDTDGTVTNQVAFKAAGADGLNELYLTFI